MNLYIYLTRIIVSVNDIEENIVDERRKCWSIQDYQKSFLSRFMNPGAVFTNHSLERSLSYSPEFSMYRSI